MIHRVGAVGSTQDLAHTLAEDGAGHGTTVVAESQRRGRGTRGRAWSSGPGGLWISVILRPDLGPGHPPTVEGLSVRVGLEVAAALEPTLGPAQPILLKWPNDFFVGDRKLGGVLCEARWTGDRPGWIVVGIGVNVVNEIGPETAAAAVRLADVGGPREPAAIETRVRNAILLAADRNGPLSPDELDAFARRNWLAGRRVEGPAIGVAGGLRADGCLLVHQADGTVAAVLDPITVTDLAPTRESH